MLRASSPPTPPAIATPGRPWRKSDRWRKWAAAIAPAVASRRRLQQLLGDKTAVTVLLSKVAPRFRDRRGGYTRIVKLAKPRLGDAGPRAILEFVGVRDRRITSPEARRSAMKVPKRPSLTPGANQPAAVRNEDHGALEIRISWSRSGSPVCSRLRAWMACF